MLRLGYWTAGTALPLTSVSSCVGSPLRVQAYLTAEQIHAHRHNLGAHFQLASTDKPVQW